MIEKKNKNTIKSYLKSNTHSVEIENSIYDYSLLYSLQNNINKFLIESIYNDKLTEIISNINKKSYLYNPNLIKKLKKKVFHMKIWLFYLLKIYVLKNGKN